MAVKRRGVLDAAQGVSLLNSTGLADWNGTRSFVVVRSSPSCFYWSVSDWNSRYPTLNRLNTIYTTDLCGGTVQVACRTGPSRGHRVLFDTEESFTRKYSAHSAR